MHIFLEVCVLVSVYVLYWYNRERRMYLKKRIGARTLKNIYQIARNINFMLTKKDLTVQGDTSVLKNGCVLYSVHFGVWELMPRVLTNMGYNVGVIVNRYGRKDSAVLEYCDRLLYRFRAAGGVRVFYKGDGLKLVRFLKAGGVVGVLVDGDTWYAKYAQAQRLSALCHVPLIPFAAYRDNGSGVLEIGCHLVTRVAKMPYDYLWLYKSRNAVAA